MSGYRFREGRDSYAVSLYLYTYIIVSILNIFYYSIYQNKLYDMESEGFSLVEEEDKGYDLIVTTYRDKYQIDLRMLSVHSVKEDTTINFTYRGALKVWLDQRTVAEAMQVKVLETHYKSPYTDKVHLDTCLIPPPPIDTQISLQILRDYLPALDTIKNK